MNDRVLVRREPITLCMAPLEEPDPNPPLPSGGSRAIYPYTRHYRFGERFVERPVEAIFLENAHTMIQVVPALGGRLWSSLNKATGHPLFHTPQRIGLINFGLRGAWYTGGIEFNFPNGHTVSSSETVSAAIRRYPDGGAAAIVGALDLVRLVVWSVGMRLQPDSSSIYLDVFLSNPTALPVRYMWWINAGVAAEETLEYVNGTREVRSHFLGRREHLGEPLQWPVHQGKDLRWYDQCVEPTSLFQLAGDARWFGFYSHALDQGVVRVGKSSQAPGLKFWNSGQAEEGYLWGKYMTGGLRYANTEMQSGRPETQMDYDFMPPHEALRYTEVWRPVWGLGGVSCASEAIAVHLLPDASSARLRLLGDRLYPGCQIQIDAQERYEYQVDIPPDRPLEIALPSAAEHQPIKVAVFAADGVLLFAFDRPGDQNRRSIVADVLQLREEPEKTPAELNAEELALQAQFYARMDEPKIARALTGMALAKDPGHMESNLIQARLDLLAGRYDAALEHCRVVLWRNPLHSWAHYLLAVAHFWKGDWSQAELEFERAVGRGFENNAACWYHIGQMELRHQEWTSAQAAFGHCLERQANHVRALALKVLALRRAGCLSEAWQVLSVALALAPLDPLVRAENWFLDRSAPSPWVQPAIVEQIQYCELRERSWWIRDALEVVWEYVACGALDEARALLLASMAPEHAEPISLYTLGYLYWLNGDREIATQTWQNASQCSPEFAFSFRREEAEVYKAVLSQQPQDGLANALLGMLETYRQNPDRAILFLEKAARLRPEWDQPHRLLAICRQMQGDPEQAAQHYWKALEINPLNSRLYVELDELLAAMPESWESRRRLWKDLPDSLLVDDFVIERYTDALANLGQYEQALQILFHHTVFPIEGSNAFRDLFAHIHMSLALDALDNEELDSALQHARAASTYPESLGLATPYVRYDSAAYVLEALILWKRGEHSEAQELFSKAATEYHRETNEAVLFSGLALRWLGKEPEALGMFRRLIKKSEEDLAWPGRDKQFAIFLRSLGKAGLKNRTIHDSNGKSLFPKYHWKATICSRISNYFKELHAR